MTATTPPAEFPLPVIVDTREQHPFEFAGLTCAIRGRPLVVRTARLALPSGDYSLGGWQHQVAIERKSASDLVGTVGQSRARFQRELVRMAALKVAAVVVEAEWSELMFFPPPYSKLHPKVLLCSIVAWQRQFPTVHWWFLPGRRAAEIVTFRMLEQFYRSQR